MVQAVPKLQSSLTTAARKTSGYSASVFVIEMMQNKETGMSPGQRELTFQGGEGLQRAQAPLSSSSLTSASHISRLSITHKWAMERLASTFRRAQKMQEADETGGGISWPDFYKTGKKDSLSQKWTFDSIPRGMP